MKKNGPVDQSELPVGQVEGAAAETETVEIYNSGEEGGPRVDDASAEVDGENEIQEEGK